MSGFGEAFFILSIKIYRDRTPYLPGLSQKSYIIKFWEINKHNNSPGEALIGKYDKLSEFQCPKSGRKNNQ